MPTALMPPFYQDERDMNETWTGVIFATYSVAFTISAFVTGKFVDRIGHRTVFFSATLLQSVCQLGFAFMDRIETNMTVIVVSIVCNMFSGKLDNTLLF